MVSVINGDCGLQKDEEFNVELHGNVPNDRNTLLMTEAQMVGVCDLKNGFSCELNIPGLL